MKKIGIVILNYKNWQDTIECLQSVRELTYNNTDIIVVDNDSQNDSLSHIHQWLSDQRISHVLITDCEIDTSATLAEKTILLQSSSNRGYAAGNNLGIRVALARGADYILILNNDTLVEKGFLEPLVNYAETHEKVAGIGPKIVDQEGNIDPTCVRRRPTMGDYFFRLGMGKVLFPNNRWIRRHTYRGEYSFDHPKEIEVLPGCCMLIKSRVFQELGLLDENTFLFLEEAILYEKLHGAGLVSAVVPESCIIHKHGQSTATMTSAFLRNAIRASLRYYLRHYRGYNRFTVALLMTACINPKDFLRR